MNQPTQARSVYVLSDAHAFATELEQRLDSSGFQVETVDSLEDYRELVLGLSPHALLVDASHADDLPAVGEIRRQAQQRLRDRPGGIPLLALLPEDNLQARLAARRAGVGGLLFPPFATTDIVRQLKELLAPPVADAERVLIVEDDRAQALFAQSVLGNAGMHAEVEQNPLHVMDALEFLQPELVLMDLHMPDANGVELTALIREHPKFRSTPIVFLSGESDPEARFDAIDAGGDDFLAKPIRPRHLIATVRNRVRRMRELGQAVSVPVERDPNTGLWHRDALQEQLRGFLAATDRGDGGVLFVRIIDASALRARIGTAAMERVAADAGKVLVSLLGANQLATGINDFAFLVVAPALDDAALDALGAKVRDALMAATFEAAGMALQLRVAVGVCPWHDGASDDAALFDQAERTARQARDLPEGVKRFVSSDLAQRRREDAEVAWLRDAITHDRIELALQPIVAIRGGVDAQFQSLLRLRDAEGQLRTAAELLPIAQRAGLLVEMDRCVLGRALALARRQQDRWKPVKLFVPQALATLSAPDQGAWLKQEIARHGGMGGYLVLGCRMEDALLNPGVLAALAAGLHKSGVRMCLSRFEHGEEAERLLEANPPAFLKLAPRYVAANATADDRAQAQRAIELAHRLGSKVIASCVEDPQVAAWLWTSGLDYVQGNLLAPPGSSLDFDFQAGMH